MYKRLKKFPAVEVDDYTMGLKRKRSSKTEDELPPTDSDSGFEEVAASEDELDIFSSLTGAKKKKQKEVVDEEQSSSQEDENDDDEVIRESMAKKRAKAHVSMLRASCKSLICTSVRMHQKRTRRALHQLKEELQALFLLVTTFFLWALAHHRSRLMD